MWAVFPSASPVPRASSVLPPRVHPCLRAACIVAGVAAFAGGCAGSDRLPVSGSGASGSPSATSSGPGAGGGHGEGGDEPSGGGDASSGNGGDDGGSGGEDAGSGSTGGAPGTGGADGAGGASGGTCGDGAVEGIEECDDGNAIDDDGCSTCVVDCEAQGVKDPLTGHCYRVFPDPTTWPFAEANCAAWGGAPGLGHLASIADAAEQAWCSR